ncbi:MAG: RsmE family RNA methyltransferase [Myxococcota bacterium]|nr:RsmE family RNA methyltransferase [Myxococcota bacterium]
MRRFFVETLPTAASPMCRLSKSETHHLFRVVKIAQGEEVELFDGMGGGCIAVLHHTRGEEALLEWVRGSQETMEPTLWLYLSLLKQQAWSTALRMVVEAGVSDIVPVCTAHSIAKHEKRERWEKIIFAATKQSGRKSIPNLHRMCVPQQVYTAHSQKVRYILSPTVTEQSSSKPDDVALWIGPEGGFSSQEFQAARDGGWIPMGLGRNTLRADTAAIVAVSHFLCS